MAASASDVKPPKYNQVKMAQICDKTGSEDCNFYKYIQLLCQQAQQKFSKISMNLHIYQ